MTEVILLTLVVGLAAGAACAVAVVHLIDRAYQEYIEQIQPPFTMEETLEEYWAAANKMVFNDKEHDDGR